MLKLPDYLDLKNIQVLNYNFKKNYGYGKTTEQGC